MSDSTNEDEAAAADGLVQRQLYAPPMGELLAQAGLAVAAHVRSAWPDPVREAAAYKAGFWYGRFE